MSRAARPTKFVAQLLEAATLALISVGNCLNILFFVLTINFKTNKSSLKVELQRQKK